MAHDEFDTPAGRLIERDRYGRPLIIPPAGGKPTAYTRCTTFVDTLDDKHNLTLWKQRMVAIGMSERPDLVLAVSATDRDDKRALNQIADKAMEAAKASVAATTGTALHALTERVDRGQPVGIIPEAHKADIDAYRRATAELQPLCVETFTVHDGYKVGGTPDRIVRFRNTAYVADIKTGSLDYGAGRIAMQLAMYAHAAVYDPATGERTGYPEPVDLDHAIVIHLPAGTGECRLYWADIGAGWDAVTLAADVRAWRKRRDLLTAWPEPSPPDEPADAQTRQLATIAAASTVDELRALYVEYVDAGADTDTINAACLERKAALERAQAA